MLTKYDEYLCHQTNAGFDQVSTTERNWSDHIWAGFYDRATDIHVGFKLGKYSNRNVMDAAGGIARDNRQITVRASRALWPDIDTEKVGPFEYEILDPLKKVRIRLDQNDYDISFDLELETSAVPMAEPGGHTAVNGVTFNKETRVYLTVRPSGKVTFKGKTYDISKDSSFGFRDHTWGVRGLTGVPSEGNLLWRKSQASPEPGLMPMPMPPGMIGALITLQTEDCSIYYTHAEGVDGNLMQSSMVAGARGYIVYPPGDGRPPVMLVDSQLDFELFPKSRRVKSVRGFLVRQDGQRMQIASQYMGSVFSLDACGYNGFRGWWNGKWMGPYAIEGEELCLTDEQALRESGSMMDIATEFNVDGRTGYGSMQAMAVGELPKYGLKASDIPWG